MKLAIEARPIRWSYGTGIGNYTHSLIEKLYEIDRENEYTFLWTEGDPGTLIPFRRKYSYYSLPREDQREEVEIPLWLNQEGAEVFHLPQNGFRTPSPGQYKVVVTIHDLIPYFYPEFVRTSFLKRFVAEMPFIVERADHIISVSEASKNDLITVFGLDPDKIAVIPSGPSAAYQPLPKERTAPWLRKKYRLSCRYILYVGGLNPRKNVSELVYAYSKIIGDLPDQQRLVILGGESKHLDKLKRLAEALSIQDDVIFPGFVPTEDLPYFYNGADLFVYPSFYEGFGLPPIEAMACATPVITSNVSSLPEVVGDAALTVSPTDTLALAEAILQVLTSPALRESLIKKGLQQCQRYNWTKIATQVLEVYRKVQQS
ncbi:glycosyltransferase involved in cell wall biosynthesis [Hydrogenispora ethanolica]|uniref:Glycosyltransferase involved in cell wall biosynthesis n=1 Tax=Hydrogenispora ethanolica TaxID=1082276 RepID=A0A4R1RYE0_HYDET|nr:glycosyltransferase family 1 protein [Hydrogenispora ethanolica]TCL70992.1 glycosyltransferase involved in cell wall biosynthesis [Hydrogenispora ethanolica]